MAHVTRVLIADSSLTTLNEAGSHLRAAGCLTMIEMAPSRVRFRARSERPDAIFLGLGFSDEELAHAADELKNDPVTRRLPLMLIGDRVMQPEISRRLARAVDGTIRAPIDGAEIAAKLATATRLKVMRAELLRRHVTLGRYGIDGFVPIDAGEDEAARTLFIGPNGGEAAGAELKVASSAVSERVGIERGLATLAQLRHDAAIVQGGGDTGEAALELCADIRRHPALFHLPVIFLTPTQEAGLASRAFAKGASEVVPLPYDPEAISLGIDVAVRQARLRSRLQAAYRRGGNPETNDPVTGLFTLEFMYRHLELLIEDAFRWNRQLSVVTCLMPQLSAIAHEHGREAASAVQRASATVISRLVRGEDLCACLGDHAFCLVLPETGIEATNAVTQRLRGVLRHTEFGISDVSRPLTLQVELGSAEFRPGDTPETLVARAQGAALSVAA